jgi:rubredoxin
MLCPECRAGKLLLIKTQHSFYKINAAGHPEDIPCDTSREMNVECPECGAVYEFEQDYNGRIVFVKRGELRMYSGEIK